MFNNAPWYGVVALIGTREIVIGEWQGDYARAESEAISAFKRYHGKASVTVMMDGGSWRHVAVAPFAGSVPVVIDAGFCLHPLCGQIPPEECYCSR